MTKVAEHCIVKLVKGSEFDDALVETKIFWVKILDEVIHGSHYDQSLRGLLIFEDVIEVLKWKAFWIKYGHPLKEPISILKELLNAFEEKDRERIRSMYENCRTAMNSIKTELNQFVSFCIRKSEVCQYCEVILN